ncbi:NepR family anti-sigma factor [Chelativorans xinjiangense]|uniref:NepR family anti-sigma factor n=1 Tax=Chelativorans xinjiangense TaxID=2681485 RepID=UPI00135C05B4|nr:NepR family anti-sigma factor [Chelativorans xinjiangense]
MKYQKTEMKRDSGERRSGSDPLGPNSEIGRKLRQYYADLISEEIPDRFNQLLSELEGKEQPQSAVKED